MKRIALITIMCAFMSASASADMADITLEVYANPLWTNTGINIIAGEVITVTPVAGDVWYTVGLGTPIGPSGLDLNDWDLFFGGSLHSSMIAYIGDPFQGRWGDGGFFPQATGYTAVNNGVVFTASVGGSLWLGCNDDAVSLATGDNSGSITTNVSVVPVPGAVLLGMLGLSVVGVKLRKRA